MADVARGCTVPNVCYNNTQMNKCTKKSSHNHLSGYTRGCRCPDCSAASRAYHKENPQNFRAGHLKRKYGISMRDYEELLAKQDFGCAICGSHCPGGRWKTVFSVDHDHETGEVRGLLCQPCNLLLGNSGDDIEVLRAAINYLSGTDE